MPEYLHVVDTDQIYRLFGRRLSEARNSCGISQQVLADRVGLSRASIANIEAGRQRIVLHQAIEMADALDLPSLSELLPSDLLRPNASSGSAHKLNLSGASLSKHEQDAVLSIVASS